MCKIRTRVHLNTLFFLELKTMLLPVVMKLLHPFCICCLLQASKLSLMPWTHLELFNFSYFYIWISYNAWANTSFKLPVENLFSCSSVSTFFKENSRQQTCTVLYRVWRSEVWLVSCRDYFFYWRRGRYFVVRLYPHGCFAAATTIQYID